MFPDVSITVHWASEIKGVKTGVTTFVDGICTFENILINYSAMAREHAAELWKDFVRIDIDEEDKT